MSQVFPSEIETFVDLRPFRVAARLSGTTGISVVSNLYPQNFDGRSVSGLQTIDVAGEVTSLARIPIYSADGSAEDELLWIERDADGQHLYKENLTTQKKTEIPYPFPSGDSGKLINNEYISPVVIDIDRVSQALLVAAVSGQNTDEIRVDKGILTSIGSDFGLTVAAKNYPDLVDDPPGTTHAVRHRMLQFSQDGKSFSSILVLQYADDPYAFQHAYAFEMASGGTWPFVAVDGDMWIEGRATVQPVDPALTHPQPFAVLTSTGEIYIDQFIGPIAAGGETFFPAFAKLPGEPTTIMTVSTPGFSTELWALESVGVEADLWDGNNHDIHSSALQPQLKKLFSSPSAHSSKTTENLSLRYISRGNVLFYL